MKDKSKRKADIAEAFEQSFEVIVKITKEMSDLYDCRFKNEFFLYANEINYVSKVLSWDKLTVTEKIDFACLILEPLTKIND